MSPPRRNLCFRGRVTCGVIPTPPPGDSAPRTVNRSESLTTELVIYYFTSLALSWAWLLLWPLPSDFAFGDAQKARDAYNQIGLFFGFGPMAASIFVTFAFRRTAGVAALFRRLLIWPSSPLWFVVALCLPIVPQWIGIAAWSVLTGAALVLPPASTWLSSWLQISVVAGLLSVGEELGWRGFMLPRVLTTRRPLAAALIVGIVWGVWHYPIWFTFNWAATGSIRDTIAILLAASVSACAWSVLITWIFGQTRGGVLPAMIFHGSINANMNVFYQRAGDAALTSLSLLACTTVATVIVAAVVARWGPAAGRHPADWVEPFRRLAVLPHGKDGEQGRLP